MTDKKEVLTREDVAGLHKLLRRQYWFSLFFSTFWLGVCGWVVRLSITGQPTGPYSHLWVRLLAGTLCLWAGWVHIRYAIKAMRLLSKD